MIRFRLSFLRADQGINELVVNEFELTRALNSYVDEHGPTRLIEVKESATENYHVEAGPYGAEMDAVAGTRRWRRMEGSDSAWVEVSAEGDPKPGDWNLMIIEPPHPRSLYEQTRMDRDLADAKLRVRKKEAAYEARAAPWLADPVREQAAHHQRPHGARQPRRHVSHRPARALWRGGAAPCGGGGAQAPGASPPHGRFLALLWHQHQAQVGKRTLVKNVRLPGHGVLGAALSLENRDGAGVGREVKENPVASDGVIKIWLLG